MTDDYATRYMKTSHLARLARQEGWSGRLREYVTDAAWVQAQLLCQVRNIGWNARVERCGHLLHLPVRTEHLPHERRVIAGNAPGPEADVA